MQRIRAELAAAGIAIIDEGALAGPDRPIPYVLVPGPAAVDAWKALRRRVEVSGVRQDVRFFGFVPDQTLAALYRLASVFAFPSLYEGFGLPPLEAMACGTPVVTSNVSSLPEIAGDAALLVDPYDTDAIADGIRRAVTDESLRAGLIARGLERARTFSWAQSVAKIHRIYMEVVAR